MQKHESNEWRSKTTLSNRCFYFFLFSLLSKFDQGTKQFRLWPRNVFSIKWIGRCTHIRTWCEYEVIWKNTKNNHEGISSTIKDNHCKLIIISNAHTQFIWRDGKKKWAKLWFFSIRVRYREKPAWFIAVECIWR